VQNFAEKNEKKKNEFILREKMIDKIQTFLASCLVVQPES
jgi:hypothetical protein